MAVSAMRRAPSLSSFRPGSSARLRGDAALARILRVACRAEARRRRAKDGGPDRDRTGDLLNAIQARSQLRYRPTFIGGRTPDPSIPRTKTVQAAPRGESRVRVAPLARKLGPLVPGAIQFSPSGRHAGMEVQRLEGRLNCWVVQPVGLCGADARATATQSAGGPPPPGSGRRRASSPWACRASAPIERATGC
jgi:hypothetical protein